MVFYVGPTTPGVQASDSTQATTANDDHKELISKLEVLEERVEKLESENQELKKESEKLAAQDSKQDGEKKISENPVKTEKDSKIDKDDETLKSHKVVPKNDDSLSQGKDNTPGAAVHKQPLTQERKQQQQQRLTQDETKEDTSKIHLDPVITKHKENDIVADKNLKNVEHKEQSKHDVPIPDLVVDKNTDHGLAPQADGQKFHLEDNPGKGTEKQQDDKILLEKPAVKLNPEIDLDQKSEHKIPNDRGEQPVGQTKRSVDDNLQNFEQDLPKLDTGGDVGILSRDLLHDSKQHDDSDTASQEKVDSTQTTALATQDKNTTKNEPKTVVKRDILSLKLTSDNETQSLSNG